MVQYNSELSISDYHRLLLKPATLDQWYNGDISFLHLINAHRPANYSQKEISKRLEAKY